CFGLVFLLSMVFRPIRANLPATKASFPILCLGLLAIAGSVYWLQQQDAAGRKLNRKVGELEEILGGSSNPTYTAGMRLARYRNAVDMFSQKPLLGWGAGAWSTHFLQRDTVSYPHNLFLEIAAEEGTVGLAALAILI